MNVSRLKEPKLGKGVQNSVLPAIGKVGGKGPKSVKNTIATQPGSNKGKVMNSIALCKK